MNRNIIFAELATICLPQLNAYIGNIRSNDIIFYKYDIIRMPKDMTLATANIYEGDILQIGVVVEKFPIRCMVCKEDAAKVYKLEISNLTKAKDLCNLVKEQLSVDVSLYHPYFGKTKIEPDQFLSGVGVKSGSDIFFFDKRLVN